jgi:hypothetical protein
MIIWYQTIKLKWSQVKIIITIYNSTLKWKASEVIFQINILTIPFKIK